MHMLPSPLAQRNASHARRLCLKESTPNTHPTARDTTFVLDMESDAKEEADESKAKTTGTSDDDGGIDATRSSSHGPITVEAAVAEEICKDLITSIAIEVAFDTHRMAKTGVLPLSHLMDPSTRSATSTSALGANKSRIRSSSFVPLEDDSEHGPQSKRSRSNTLASDATGAGEGVGDISNDAINGTQQQQEQQQQHQQQQPVGADIWGRIPPKEPKIMPKCDICGRQVSALRFAVHLDKCPLR